MIERFHFRNRHIFAIDLALITLSVVLSHWLRLSARQVIYDYYFTVLVMLGLALVIKPLVYNAFGLYRRFWAYASTRELVVIARAVSLASLLVGGIMYLLYALGIFTFFARSVPIIDWMLSLLLVGGLRFLPRYLTDSVLARQTPGAERPVLIVGAGDAGALVVRELQKNPQLKLTPVAFLDDDIEKQSVRIHDVPVVGTLADLNTQLGILAPSEVIIAIPSAPGQVVRQVADVCRQRRVPFRTMPGIYELLGGTVSVNRLREVEITDLLRREHAHIDHERVNRLLAGKRILVTGAGGSIASELCRQVARLSPSNFVLVGHGENSIFEIMVELEQSFPDLPKYPVIADVRDRQRLAQVFKHYQPQVVFHAAAHKHVSLMEKNIEEAVTNNVLGTRNVVEAAVEQGVERLVMISTDKAVRPTTVMGATKRLAEMIVLNAAAKDGLAYSVVRFGNVLGSRGSVVPLFKRQIAAGGPVTVRHPDVERYFMTIPEAVHLVLQAFAMGQGGEVFLLNMGEPVKILDLATDLIRLSGLEPGEDIEIMFTGLRPGEKLSEVLWDEDADYHQTEHPEINVLAAEQLDSNGELPRVVDELVACAQDGNTEGVIDILEQYIPGAKLGETPVDDLTALIY